jgi:hypothetical protein
MSFKFLQAKRIEEEVFSEEEKAELLELAEFWLYNFCSG